MRSRTLLARRTCGAWEPLLWDYSREHLTVSDRARVEVHLATCAACRKRLDTICAVANALSGPQRPPVPASQASWADLKAQLQAGQADTTKPRRNRLVPASAWASAAIAGLLLVALFRPGSPSLPRGNPRQTYIALVPESTSTAVAPPSLAANKVGWALMNATSEMEPVGEPILQEHTAHEAQNGLASGTVPHAADQTAKDIDDFARERQRHFPRYARPGHRRSNSVTPKSERSGRNDMLNAASDTSSAQNDIVDGAPGRETMPPRNFVMTPVGTAEPTEPVRHFVIGTVDAASPNESEDAGSAGGQEKRVW